MHAKISIFYSLPQAITLLLNPYNYTNKEFVSLKFSFTLIFTIILHFTFQLNTH